MHLSFFLSCAGAAFARRLKQDPSQPANTGELVVPVAVIPVIPIPSPSPLLVNETVASPSPNDTLVTPLRRHLLQSDVNITDGNTTTNFTGVEFQDADDSGIDAGSVLPNVTEGNTTTGNFTGTAFQDDAGFGNATDTNATTNFTGTEFRFTGRKLMHGRRSLVGAGRRAAHVYTLLGHEEN